MEKKHASSSPLGRGDLEQLIELEWKLIEQLKVLAETTEDERARVQYYLNLSSHARTLAYLIGQCGGGVKEGQDLAKLLSRINAKARRLARLLKNERSTAAASG